MNWNFIHSKNCCDVKDAIKKESSFQNGRNPLQTKYIRRSLHLECTKKSFNSIIKGNPIKNWQENY